MLAVARSLLRQTHRSYSSDTFITLKLPDINIIIHNQCTIIL